MDYIPLVPAVLFFVVLAFQAGRISVSHPSEEEMIRRIKRARYERKTMQEADAEVEEELRLR